MENELVNKKIRAVWEKHPDKRGDFHPLYIPDIKKNCVLFIGLNPSFNENGFKQIFKNYEKYKHWTYKDYESYFKLTNNNFKEEESIEIEKHAQSSNLSYFKKFGEISKEWAHLDLFFYRATSQRLFKKNVIEYVKEKKHMSDFGKDQLKISIEIIKKNKPKVIVVANALASQIIRSPIIDNGLIIDKNKFKEEGFHRMDLDNQKIPIFFSGMFAGTAPLDKGSFERLKWQIEQALNKI